MKSLLSVEQYLANRQQSYLIDVRSPGEFRQSHIPGAVNVPLFTDEERAQVGTAYWQEGINQAKLLGLSLVSPRLVQMVEQIVKGAGGRDIVVCCWRGGMRSRSVFSLLESLGYPAKQLVGGYKAFRRQVIKYFNTKTLDIPVYVLNGLTGVGKTKVIHKLREMGAPAIDLEEMANHRGSAFGAVGLGAPRTQKDFDSLLFLALTEYQDADYLIVEGEGKKIGPVILPDFLYSAMREGRHILLEADLEMRVDRILEEYHGSLDNAEELASAVHSLQKKLGRDTCEELAAKLRSGDYLSVAQNLCTGYYDRYYCDSRQKKSHYLAVVNVNDLNRGAAEILSLFQRNKAERGYENG